MSCSLFEVFRGFGQHIAWCFTAIRPVSRHLGEKASSQRAISNAYGAQTVPDENKKNSRLLIGRQIG
jgi:hypothetical protein